MDKRDVYMNKVQQRIFYAGARDIRVSAARRFGKTDGTIGPYVWRVAQSMPCGAGAWVGSSKKQLYTRTVPGTIAAIERFYGFKEGVHFGWGRPPKSVPQCIVRPKTYENCIWFANGFIYHLVSLAVFGSANSFTLNNIVADECKFLPKKKIDGELMPALSGITHPLGDKSFSEYNPYYKSTMFCSDASLTSKGNWLEHEEEKLDIRIERGPFEGKTYRDVQAELDEYAELLIFYNELLRNAKKENKRVLVVEDADKERILALAEAIHEHSGPFKILPHNLKNVNKGTLDYCVSYKLISPEDAELLESYRYLITKEQHFQMMRLSKSKSYKEHIRELRCNSFYFVRASSLDNIDLLGVEYIERMRRDLPPLTFRISILNERVKKSSDGFYNNLDIENVHGYICDDCPALDSSYKVKETSTLVGGTMYKGEYETPDFKRLQSIDDCSKDGDVMNDLPLHISGDWNANINWFVVGQEYKRDGVQALNIINSMFVQNEEKLHALCAKFDRYYRPHKSHNNTVYFYYDQTAKFKSYAVEGVKDFKDTVIEDLTKYGWNVVQVDMRQTMTHVEKYKLINEALAGVSYPAIRFNKENNEDLIMAMENTGVKVLGPGKFKKDKSGEKLNQENEDGSSTPLSLRTDGTDAFDNLYIGVKCHKVSLYGFCMPMGGM